jgi:hypothetical protein
MKMILPFVRVYYIFLESVSNEQHYHKKRIRAYQVKQYQLMKFLRMK